MCDGNFKKKYSKHQPTCKLNVDRSGGLHDKMLESRISKTHNLFGVAMLHDVTTKSMCRIEGTSCAKENHKHSTLSCRKKRELCENFIAWTKYHLDWDEENAIY